MKKNKLKKAIALSLVLAAMTLSANNLNAQDGGGLFGKGETAAGNRGGEPSYTLNNQKFGDSTNPYDITNETFGDNTSPVGSGLGILIAAGLGYVALKKKED